MVGQAIQGVDAGSRYGVPAASPPSPGTLRIACSGQASMQAPHRVHAARNPISAMRTRRTEVPAGDDPALCLRDETLEPVANCRS